MKPPYWIVGIAIVVVLTVLTVLFVPGVAESIEGTLLRWVGRWAR